METEVPTLQSHYQSKEIVHYFYSACACFYFLLTFDVLIQVLHIESKENNVSTSYQLCFNIKHVEHHFDVIENWIVHCGYSF